MKNLIVSLSALLLISCSITGSGSDSEEQPETHWETTSDSTAVWVGSNIEASGEIDATENPDHVEIQLLDLGTRQGNGEYDAWAKLKTTFDESHQIFEEDEWVTIQEKVISSASYNSDSNLMDVLEFTTVDCSRPNSPCENGEANMRFPEPQRTIYLTCDEEPSSTDTFEMIYRDAEKLIFSYQFESTGIEEVVKDISCN